MSGATSHTGDSVSNSPGAILKRCREYHELTLEEAADATKIGISYLRALEDDRVEEFANLAYLKGFLRIYATYLGLNAEDMARMYDKLFGESGTGDAAAPSSRSIVPLLRRIPVRKLAFPAILLFAMIIVSLFIRRSPTTTTTTRQSSPAPQSAANPVVAVQPVRTSVLPAPVVKEGVKPDQGVATAKNREQEEAKPSRLSEPVKNGFVLKVRVTQNGSLTATVDDLSPQTYELAVGDVIEWKAEKNVALELSNAGGVEAELDGRQLKPLGAAGRPASIVVDADGFK